MGGRYSLPPLQYWPPRPQVGLGIAHGMAGLDLLQQQACAAHAERLPVLARPHAYLASRVPAGHPPSTQFSHSRDGWSASRAAATPFTRSSKDSMSAPPVRPVPTGTMGGSQVRGRVSVVIRRCAGGCKDCFPARWGMALQLSAATDSAGPARACPHPPNPPAPPCCVHSGPPHLLAPAELLPLSPAPAGKYSQARRRQQRALVPGTPELAGTVGRQARQGSLLCGPGCHALLPISTARHPHP